MLTAPEEARLQRVGMALEAFAVWARVLDSHQSFPFGEVRLARAQWEALFLVAHSAVPATPSSLATALGVTRGAVTQLLAGLFEAGLVEQRVDARDGRRRVLSLSVASKARVEGFERDLAASLAPRFAALTDAELAVLVELLNRTREVR